MYLIQKCEDNLFETLEKNKDSYVMKGATARYANVSDEPNAQRHVKECIVFTEC